MRTLSMDLRERIVSAYENKEGTHLALAKRFSVSKAVVGKLVRQQREQGTLEPQVHLRCVVASYRSPANRLSNYTSILSTIPMQHLPSESQHWAWIAV